MVNLALMWKFLRTNISLPAFEPKTKELQDQKHSKEVLKSKQIEIRSHIMQQGRFLLRKIHFEACLGV